MVDVDVDATGNPSHLFAVGVVCAKYQKEVETEFDKHSSTVSDPHKHRSY